MSPDIMSPDIARNERRTNVDDVHDYLHEQIVTLQLKPGDRISEAEIAAQFGISRQPVRDAFSRLANNNLLLIRPQRATVVRRFSMRQLEKARFLRTSIEKEVLLRAAVHCDDKDAHLLEASLEQQDAAMASENFESFAALDYEFHRILCSIAKVEFAFEIILEEKAKVDRLCMLAHEREQHMPDLVADHRKIAHAIITHDKRAAIAAGMKHLYRLDETITRIQATNADYFEHTGA